MANAKLLVSVYNNVGAYPELSDVAARLKLSVRQVEAALERLPAKLANKLISRSRSALPLSEDSSKRRSATREECIEELRRIVSLDETKVISRNYFRVNSMLAESAWNAHFGTFAEFKRQGGIVLTRNQHKLERELAKHASVDHYRELNEERFDYADKYQKPNGKRFVTLLACSDLHDKEIDPFWLRVWLDTVKRVQPQHIAFVGDVFDLPEFGKYTVDPRDWDVTGRIQFVHEQILGPTRAAAPEAEIDLQEGNHEARLLRHLADASPAMRAVLADLHGFNLAKLLGLDSYEINYIARGDLAAWTVRDHEKELSKNYKVYYDCFVAHHFPHAQKMGMPGVNGHHHRHQAWPFYSPHFGPYSWVQMGCGHKRQASFCEGEQWHLGFDIVHIDREKKRVQHEYVTVGDYAIVGGKWYVRESGESAQ